MCCLCHTAIMWWPHLNYTKNDKRKHIRRETTQTYKLDTLSGLYFASFSSINFSVSPGTTLYHYWGTAGAVCRVHAVPMTHFYTSNDLFIFFVLPSQPITVIKGPSAASGSIHFTLCAWFSSGEIKIKRAEGLQIANDFYSVWNHFWYFFCFLNHIWTLQVQKTKNHLAMILCY